MKRQILGLDISDDFVAAVVVQQSGQERRMLSCGSVELRSRQQLDDVLPELLQQVSWNDGSCICGISLDGISLRNLNVPFADKKKLDQVLPLELEDQLLVPVDDQVLDYLVTSSKENGSSILVAGIEKQQLRTDLDALQQSGVRPRCITIRNLALAEKFIQDTSMPAGFLLLDFGAYSIDILFVHNRRVVFIRRLACPDGVFSRAPFSFKDGLVSLAQGDDAKACIITLCQDIKRSIGLYRLHNEVEFQPQQVVVSGSMADVDECREIISLELELEVRSCNLQESAGVILDESGDVRFRSAVHDHALALALRGFRKKQPINFRKDEFAPETLFFASRAQRIGAASAALLLLGVMFVLLGLNYHSLNGSYDAMGEQMKALYKESFPEATRIVDPLVQMQANVRGIQAPAIATPVFSGEKRVLNILSDISAGVSESIEIHVSRLVIDQESVQLKGVTDTFNNVNLIQSSLDKAPRFDDVAIVSAAADKETGMIRFELRLQMKGGA